MHRFRFVAAASVRSMSTSADIRISRAHRLPVVDVPSSASPCANAGEAMLRHLATTGYFGVRCGAVPQTLMNAAFEQSRSFFELPLEARTDLAWRDPLANRGYYHIDTPSGGGSSGLDFVAVHVMGSEVPRPEMLRAAWLKQSEHPSLVSRCLQELLSSAAAPNQWPADATLPQFRPVFEAYHQACTIVGEAVLASLALAVGLAPERLLALHSLHDHTVELKRFPVLPTPAAGSRAAAYFAALQRVEQEELKEKSVDSCSLVSSTSDSRELELLAQSVRRVGAHTDFCSLTLLALPCDDVGGLQERSVGGAYHHVARMDDVLLVHVGDMLETLLAGAVVSTKHRVVAPTSTRAWRDPRYTMQFFMSPDRHARIAPLLSAPETGAPLPLLLRGNRPEGGALCGDLVLERHDSILAPRMELF